MPSMKHDTIPHTKKGNQTKTQNDKKRKHLGSRYKISRTKVFLYITKKKNDKNLVIQKLIYNFAERTKKLTSVKS